LRATVAGSAVQVKRGKAQASQYTVGSYCGSVWLDLTTDTAQAVIMVTSSSKKVPRASLESIAPSLFWRTIAEPGRPGSTALIFG
jgi:hypothetical protein